jgi:opacity protein-like surface antigen
MRKFVLPLIAVAAMGAAATPALANETRAEARTGVIWGGGDTEATAGVAAGYDFDLGPGAFSGVEVSADKILTSNTKTGVGFTGRLGLKLPVAKVYVAGGYTTKFCDLCEGQWHTGLGAELPLGPMLYGKAEYRHYYADNAADSNAVMAGIGVKF